MRPAVARMPYRRRSIWARPLGALVLLLATLVLIVTGLAGAAFVVWQLAGLVEI